MPLKAEPTRKTSWSAWAVSTLATARSTVFSCSPLESRPGYLSLEITAAPELFRHEAGGHRWQRIPPTEKRGRVHTSTITVAVLEVSDTQGRDPEPADVEWKAVRGSGKGGQARNKTSNAVITTHIPTGISVRVESDRSQWKNRRAAAAILAERVRAQSDRSSEKEADRRRQVGSGMRGDKRRTIRVRDDRVHDHITGTRTTLKRYEQGHLEDLR